MPPLKYHQHALEHEGEHVLEDLGQRLAQQGMDLDTYFKVRNTTREQFIEDEVKPVAKKRFERSLVLDEIVRREKIEVDNRSSGCGIQPDLIFAHHAGR